jgi:ATP-dependent exoDNAse (exonuclease V) beta subunit
VVIPLPERIEAVADDADLEEVYDTERHLLYVACTRARDRLLVIGIKPGSEFLDNRQPLKVNRTAPFAPQPPVRRGDQHGGKRPTADRVEHDRGERDMVGIDGL